MEQHLKSCLYSYVIQNNPELLLALQGEQKINEYLDQKVMRVGPLMDRLIGEEAAPHEIERECMEELTSDLRPSKFHFVLALLRRDFPNYYQRLRESGTLTLAVTDIISFCIDLFETFGFSAFSSSDAGFLYALKNGVLNFFRYTTATNLLKA